MKQKRHGLEPCDAVLDEFTTYQVEGSVVDYLASDG